MSKATHKEKPFVHNHFKQQQSIYYLPLLQQHRGGNQHNLQYASPSFQRGFMYLFDTKAPFLKDRQLIFQNKI